MNELIKTYSLLPSGSPTVISETVLHTVAGLYCWAPTNNEGSDPYFDVESSIVTADSPWESVDSQASE